MDCRADTGKIGEHYMLIDETWRQVYGSPVGMLCIGCCELRLGRKLTRADFNESHINRVKPGESKSIRLMARLAANH